MACDDGDADEISLQNVDYSDDETRLAIAQCLYHDYCNSILGEAGASDLLVARIQVSLQEAFEMGQSSPVVPGKLH